jgi:2-polyprenyl-3-methyl-5-hydroxy-6-metoxy-1,4-benzoquinol methylase
LPEERQHCPVCDSNRARTDSPAIHTLNLGRPFAVVRCEDCGMRWLSPRPTADEYNQMYRLLYFANEQSPVSLEFGALPEWMSEYPQPAVTTRRFHESHAEDRLAHSERQLASIAARKPNRGRMLEIGAGHGEFLALARSVGWQVSGIEPSKTAVAHARLHQNLELVPTTLEAYTTDEQFDVIYLSHVFEHVLEPSAVLATIKRLLAPGGLLALEVPNQFESWVRRLAKVMRMRSGRERTIYSIHHTLFFGPHQLAALLAHHGFRVELTTHFATDFAGTVMRRLLGVVDAAAAAIASQGEVLYAEATLIRR